MSFDHTHGGEPCYEHGNFCQLTKDPVPFVEQISKKQRQLLDDMLQTRDEVLNGVATDVRGTS